MIRYDHNTHVAQGERLFESLLTPPRPGEIHLAQIALALRDNLWENAFQLERAHALSQRFADCPHVQKGTADFASRLRGMALAHLLLLDLRPFEKEFLTWLVERRKNETTARVQSIASCRI